MVFPVILGTKYWNVYFCQLAVSVNDVCEDGLKSTDADPEVPKIWRMAEFTYGAPTGALAQNDTVTG